MLLVEWNSRRAAVGGIKSVKLFGVVAGDPLLNDAVGESDGSYDIGSGPAFDREDDDT